VLEDFLDGWPGTLVVVSHDRYFLERVTDSVWALMGDGQISMLPNGVDQYLDARKKGNARVETTAAPSARSAPETPRPSGGKAKVGGSDERAARKTVARLDKQLARLNAREAAIHDEMLASASDPEKLKALSAEAQEIAAQKADYELEWLNAVALLE
jgi:ATP-binding cassette subfamily F protein uup